MSIAGTTNYPMSELRTLFLFRTASFSHLMPLQLTLETELSLVCKDPPGGLFVQVPYIAHGLHHMNFYLALSQFTGNSSLLRIVGNWIIILYHVT